MVKTKTPAEIEILRESGKRLATVLYQVAAAVKPGVKTRDLNDLAEKLIEELGDKPAFKNYRPAGSPLAYPTALCTSVNDEVVHGLPSNRELKEGDIISLDLGLNHKGMFTDMAVTVPVGEIDDRLKTLIADTKEALEVGIFSAQANNHVGDIGHSIEEFIKGKNKKYGIVRDLAGHGVGYAPHEDPFVPNFGRAGTGLALKPGLVIAIEPMVCLGTGDVTFARDGFSFKTRDGKVAAHFEHTIVITDDEPEIITKVE